MDVTRIGLDIAKNVFQVHGVDAHDTVVVRKQLSRSKVLAYFAQLPACRIGIEACGSAHYWGRELQKLVHDVRLMAVQLIKPYRTKQKNDRNAAEAICEAVSRPQMRFVPIKTVEQQAVLTVHRARELLGAERTAVTALVHAGWMDYAMNKTQPPRMGNRDVWMSPHNCFRCAGEDEGVTIACGTEDEWQALCRAIGYP
jgi:transposase